MLTPTPMRSRSLMVGLVALGLFSIPLVHLRQQAAEAETPGATPLTTAPPKTATKALDLPDDGPRFDATLNSPEASLFRRGIEAYRSHEVETAQSAFRTLIEQHPDSRFIEASQAFLAEMLVDAGTDNDRRLAIEAYRRIIRVDPNSANASRARWRIGDLYAEAGWLTEARAAYELALSGPREDQARAMLGLGVVLMQGGQWKEAERAFRQLTATTQDERLLAPAVFGLSDVLYLQARFEEAQAFYDAGTRRWFQYLKQRPQSLLFEADLKMRLHKPAEARSLYAMFYNLYPQREEAAQSLIRIGDSWRQAQRADYAAMFYGAVLRQYSETIHEAVARMRLAELGQALAGDEPEHTLQWTVGGLFRIVPAAIFDHEEQEAVFRSVAQAYRSSKVGSEALYRLGRHYEELHRRPEAVEVYRQLSDRKGELSDDPWPDAAGRRLVSLLSPWIGAALQAHDDLTALGLFYRHGVFAENLYAETGLLLRLADAHLRMGFSPQAVKLYQALLRDSSPEPLREQALFGLGRSYLDQQDYSAARRVFERYLIQYPNGVGKADGLKLLAVALYRQGDRSGAIRICNLWLRRPEARSHGDRPEILRLLALAESEGPNLKAALRAFAEAEKAGGLRDDADRIRYADVLMRVGRHEEAMAQYRYVIRRAPVSEDAEWSRFQSARAQLEEKRPEEAQALLKYLRDEAMDQLFSRTSSAILADLTEAASGG